MYGRLEIHRVVLLALVYASLQLQVRRALDEKNEIVTYQTEWRLHTCMQNIAAVKISSAFVVADNHLLASKVHLSLRNIHPFQLQRSDLPVTTNTAAHLIVKTIMAVRVSHLLICLAIIVSMVASQIINPWTGREQGIEDLHKRLLSRRQRLQQQQQQQRPQPLSEQPLQPLFMQQQQPLAQERSDPGPASEYFLSDGKTPIYKFFKKFPYGKK